MSFDCPIKLLSSNAKVPTRGSECAAGFDLYSAEPLTMYPKEWKIIPTDIAIAIPDGYFGKIAPRSSLAVKGIDVLGGIIDSDYRGNIKVILINHGTDLKVFYPGDRIAQLIILPYIAPKMIITDDLPQTNRGIGGFGSTGK